jgi:hypothetical protein
MTMVQLGGLKTHLYMPQRGCVWRMGGTIIYKEEDFPDYCTQAPNDASRVRRKYLKIFDIIHAFKLAQ